MDPADIGKVTAALDEQGIEYELRNNGTALAVEKSQTAQARIALAGKGLGGGSGAQPGFELFDKQKIGTSDFQQQVTYQRALEGQISKTIDQVQGVNGSQVRLVLADDQLFSESSTPATAAVLLTGSSSALEPSAVRGIAQLVSSSVKGLKLANVSITDGCGRAALAARRGRRRPAARLQADRAGALRGAGRGRPRARCSRGPSDPARPRSRSAPTSTPTRRRRTS